MTQRAVDHLPVVEDAAVTVAGPLVRVDDVLSAVRLDGWTPPGPVAPLRDAMRRFEREFIAAALARHDGRIGPTAKALGVQRPNLYRKLRALQLRAPAGDLRKTPSRTAP